ncbi:hypothetical protein ABB37_07727 [Leptomonas pyrrhocoris]|uniref:Uncharacterized protein n=1 Tax=Leptomonas pyrrhocoris TaxID=157538 RepID=A0A0M9FUT0_LEPPY|nr:hypothetical protein ABB37_07727 [Leptomonas pyrrhocoris]KPA76387.1 hypothetical protein ABB37_07727 [Leptomonas pyrrhocoris]|eukprot:XP_015654826.1 hypothetical protein ABB37_07727 [Leptomonas pyrrhocoris]
MDALNYVTSDANIQPCKSDVTLSKTSAANFTAGAKPVLASHRRLLCMNVKQTNVLRVLNRHGKHNDTAIKAASVAHLVSTEKMTGHPTLFYAVGGRDLAIICPNTQANGDISVSVVESTLDEEAFASTAGESQRLYILGTQNVMEVEESTGTVKSKIALAPKTAVKYPVIDYHQSAQLLLVPAKATHLDLVSTRTRRSALGRVWEPHEDNTPTFACFFQHHAFSEESGDEVLVVTAAQGNREIRFWAYQSDAQKFTLKQQLNLSHKDEPNEEYDISVTADEEYITLCSRTRPYAVVIETHHTLFKAYRTTSWRMAGPALCSTTSVGKVTETAQSKSVSYELFITIRTKDGFVQSMPNSSRLAGASNLSAARGDSVMNWFPSVAAAAGAGDGSAAGAAGGSARAAMTPITAVSSSLSGESKTSGMSEHAVSALVRTQAQKFCEQVRVIDTDLVGMQKTVSDTMRLLQDSRHRTEAQNSGRTFAIRNRARLEKSSSAVASPATQTPAAGAADSSSNDAEYGVLTEGEHDLILSIRNFVQEVQGGSAAAASAALKTLLAKQLHISVERAASETGKLDVQGPILSNLNNTESMVAFRRSVDESLKRVGAATTRYRELNRATVDASAVETERRLTEAEAFRQKLTTSLRSLKEEMGDLKVALSQYQLSTANGAGGGAAAAMDPEAIVASAVEKARAEEWKEAVTAILAADDISILLAFLENPVCKENQAVVTSPKTLTLPLFLSLCLQLTFEMVAQTGSVPLRLQLLSDFYFEWDDYLRSIRNQAQKDPQQNATFEIVKRELSTVLESLDAVPSELLDRKIRNKARLVRKLISNLITGE